jgi:hypothetical protein
LLVTRSVFLFVALDPIVFEEAVNGSVERTGAKTYAPGTEPFDVRKYRISMSRLLCETRKYQDDRFVQRLDLARGTIPYDMSHNDILCYAI